MTACRIDGCTRPHEARGWCSTHYGQWRRTGDPIPAVFTPAACSVERCVTDSREYGLCHKHAARVSRTGSTADRPTLKERLDAKTVVTPACWLWTGVCTPGGYGQIGVSKDRMEYVHRVAYREYVGPIPEGFHVDHLCRVRHCVNPAHLEPVTPAENARRRDQPRRMA